MIAEVGFALFAAHWVGDHWVQSDHQAMNKEHWWAACLAHVATYFGTQCAFMIALFLFIEERPIWWVTFLALIVNAATHYWADRRAPLKRLAVRLGKGEYWERGGAYQLDQSWHIGWLFVTALIIGGTA